MYLEDRVNELEKQVKELTDKVAHLESVNNDKWVSAKELAEIMGCSVNNIYIRIRSGEIYASRKLGSPKIPLSQFYYEGEMIAEDQDEYNRELNEIRERIFGE